MNKYAKQWVKTLKTTKRRQGSGYLCQIVDKQKEYCCLGIACELNKSDIKNIFVEKTNYPDNNYVKYDGQGGILPKHIKEKLGLRTANGRFYQTKRNKKILHEILGLNYYYSLADLNDVNVDFKTIARIIEAQPDGLFT